MPFLLLLRLFPGSERTCAPHPRLHAYNTYRCVRDSFVADILCRVGPLFSRAECRANVGWLLALVIVSGARERERERERAH